MRRGNDDEVVIGEDPIGEAVRQRVSRGEMRPPRGEEQK